MATFNTLPDKELFDMAKAAGCPIPNNVQRIDISSSHDEATIITFTCVMEKKMAEVYAAWVLSKRMQG